MISRGALHLMSASSQPVVHPHLRLEHGVGTQPDLGALLVAHRAITQAQLTRAVSEQERSGESLKHVMVRLGIASESDILRVLAAHKGIRPWHLDRDAPMAEAVTLLPPEVCRAHFVLPVKVRGDLLILAMLDPSNMVAIEAARSATGLRIEPVLADEERLLRFIEAIEGGETRLDGLVSQALGEAAPPSHRRQTAVLTETDTRPVVGLVNQILSDAITAGASDIHIEPRQGRVDLRYRVDGRLQKVREIPADLHQMLTTRLKIMAELDIVEYRTPQDGRMSVSLDGRAVDVRVSVLPNYHGQRIVLRLLDSGLSLRKLDDVGFSHVNLTLFRSLIAKPHGLILLTGPTGSGKTTTLYAALSEIKTVEDKIVTIEDPVEYQLRGITQIPINEKKGLTFARGLRSILRHDPDKVMVGEIRDPETAQIAIQSALTGHLVFTTVHANNVFDVLGRFLNMGVEPYQFISALNCVMAQRLVRKICDACRHPVTLDAATIAESAIDPKLLAGKTLYEGAGCIECGGTGFKGRMAICELLDLTDHIREIILDKRPISEVKRAAKDQGMRLLRESAVERVLEGLTTLREINKVTFVE